MSPSLLRGFNRRSVNELVDLGVHMVYDHSLIKKNRYRGLWYPNYNLICINPLVQENEGKQEENRTINHEWLHALGDLLLDPPRDFKESQIEYWAKHHLRRDPTLTDYIRSLFPDFGFK